MSWNKKLWHPTSVLILRKFAITWNWIGCSFDCKFSLIIGTKGFVFNFFFKNIEIEVWIFEFFHTKKELKKIVIVIFKKKLELNFLNLIFPIYKKWNATLITKSKDCATLV
jgi:hypothetical protein